MPTAELDVLKPIDPSLSNSDDYEIWNLSNAHVCYARNGKPASLLAAYDDRPLKVEGRLEQPDRSLFKYLLRKPFKPVDLQVTGVTRFSYGQTQGGEIVLWALGEAGWFELRPHRAYKDIYDGMVQAVEILYFLTDIYNAPRKRGGGPSAQLIFQEYAEDARFACSDPAEVADIFHKHREFLLLCFLDRAQGLGWSNTPIYQYFKRQFPKDFETAKARHEGRYAAPKDKPAKADAPASKPKPKAAPKAADKTDAAPRKDDNWWEAMAIFEFMQKAVNRGAMHVGNITLDRVAKLIVKRYEIDEYETAKNVILVHASNLKYIMDHPRRKNIKYFASEALYDEIAAGHSLPAAVVRKAEGVELRPRNDHAALSSESESETDSSEAVETPRPRPRRQKKGRLSVLRPKSSKFSGKGKSVKSRKGKGKAPPNADSDPDAERESPAPEERSDSDAVIDTPTQALSPGKRKHVPEAAEALSRKRAASASPIPDAEVAPSSPPPSSPSAEEDVSNEPLPLRWRSGHVDSTSPALLPTVISTPLPGYTANGPGDSWICTFDGCSQKVYGVSTELGRKLIKEHLQDHAKGRQKEVGIVMSEEQRLRLPVNNLLKRIREMSELQQPLFPTLKGPTRVTPTPN